MHPLPPKLRRRRLRAATAVSGTMTATSDTAAEPRRQSYAASAATTITAEDDADADADTESTTAFWRDYDRRISVGGANSAGRELVDAMVDEVAAGEGWRVDAGRGTFNDALSGSRNSMHPVVMAFVRARVEQAHVVLAPEHLWLAVLQGAGAMLRHVETSRDPARPGPRAGESLASCAWRALRASSSVPASCRASSGHEVRLFMADALARHALYGNRGAAPVAMAAAAAGSRGRTRCARGTRTNPAWVDAVARGPGARGLRLAGTQHAWAALCAATRQLKELYSAHAPAFAWWLHRVHLLARDLADHFAAPDDPARRAWLDAALADGHSGAPRGARLDGWLAALFPLDARGRLVHEQHRWALDWDCVPDGLDLLRLDLPRDDLPAVNLFSGFVGVQQLSHHHGLPAGHSRTRTRTRTLIDSDVADATEPAQPPPPPLPDAPRAMAPLIGWAMDR
ncbi:hypothetical protein GGI04_000485 [Coemansia thaxteri]|nr:hypothetical protein GGI04_000485 [Coemansia thaxteri]KAJ2473922.1 hypothetical protein GGI02_000494 [Coemansia sp. RSA 2322]